MNIRRYKQIEDYMLSCMRDSAHDKEHVYRVLFNALEIAAEEAAVDYDVLITACLLHDVGRQAQMENPALCHARAGSEMAENFLNDNGFDGAFVSKVKHCIVTHRFRKQLQPESLEAKILFDADKLDVTGALGIARSLMYKGNTAEPIYTRNANGDISSGDGDVESSFFREYKFKLEKLYDRFYTVKGAAMARERGHIAAAFYESLYREVSLPDQTGRMRLQALLEND